MSTILAHITVKPGTEAEFETIARDLHAPSHTSEPGLIRYEYWRGAEPRTYYTLLSFVDQRAFIEHQISDHHEEASPRIGAVVESIKLEFVDPIQGASDSPPTNDQEPAEGASELAVTYHGSYAAKVADWWLSLR